MDTTTQETFVCCTCGETKPVNKFGGTGYGTDDQGRKHCFACCGKRDEEYMASGGRVCLYLSRDKKRLGSQARIHDHNRQITTADCAWHVTNWPGTLDIPIYYVRVGRHNIARVRRDVWFAFAGHNWHGVMYGNDIEIVHCKVVK